MTPDLNSPQHISHTRVGRIREKIINAPQEICIERARYLTRSMQKNWHEHPLTRMSMALEDILTHISVRIREDELIVGCRTAKLKGAPLFPENKIRAFCLKQHGTGQYMLPLLCRLILNQLQFQQM